ncbi:SH3 domain-containing protein [Sneathiella litorea]|uniref:SH3 domain-containing protein n=1 Tax=Sneathiella litorea TaxID=2606216 RepID=A0A6L8WAV0_9PROT|nr:SH3 domain-containing protein [Sneathiella litorea]MZR31582.1 SH3 domain-containing protein [Sneathiella litorea]
MTGVKKLNDFCFFRSTAFVFATAIFLAGSANADNVTSGRHSISSSSAATLIKGKIEGYEIHEYRMTSDANQTLSVDMKSSNPGAYFDIQRSGSDRALFSGQRKGAVADVYTNEPGDFLIKVYLARSAANREEKATYSLAIGIHGPDFADGLAGGPDYWKVRGVGGGQRLNVRIGPSTRYAIIDKVNNGDVLQNMGCRKSFTERWCQVSVVGIGTSGWVAGKYLREAPPP